jgi:hypothetical protein
MICLALWDISISELLFEAVVLILDRLGAIIVYIPTAVTISSN